MIQMSSLTILNQLILLLSKYKEQVIAGIQMLMHLQKPSSAPLEHDELVSGRIPKVGVFYFLSPG